MKLCAAAAPQPLVVRLPSNSSPGAAYGAVQVSAIQKMQAQMPMPPAEIVAPGDPVGGLSLDQLTAITLANNPAIRAAQQLVFAARGKALQASLYPNPIMGTASPQLAADQSQYNAYVFQDLVTKGKIGLDTAAATRAVGQAEMALVRARFDALTVVRQFFATALAMQQRVELLERMVHIATSSLKIGQGLVEQGVGPRSDVLLLEIELAKAEAELSNGRTLADASRRQLAAATGLIELDISRVAGDLKQPLPNYELVAVQQEVLARNALVRSAQLEISRNDFLYQRARVEPFPNINMMGGYQNQANGVDIPENQAIYQFQMIVPLWNKNQGNIRASQANIGAAAAQYNRVRTELAANAAAAVGRYLTARQWVDRYEDKILPGATKCSGSPKRFTARGRSSSCVTWRHSARYWTRPWPTLAQETRWHAAAVVAGLLQSETFP